ncbi:DUF883 family protein [Orrella sp. JC864]|uniref:DUF883 family protein n=1 Tax=Orrella sp. JC864 TaxID=3120298 RepID=UPI0012BD1009
MFSRSKSKWDQGRDQAQESFQELVERAERLLRSTADYGGEEMDSARKTLKRQLASARSAAREWEDVARERTGRAARVADAYVHEHAWTSLGVVAVAGVVIGCLAACACLSRR